MKKAGINSIRYKNSNEHYTPEWVTRPLGPFDLDPCAGPVSSIAKVNYRLPDQNGLELEWRGFVWCNPPFNQKMQWFGCMKAHGNGLLLLTDATSSPWFSSIAGHCGWVFFFGRKINFGTGSNPMGSVLFPFGDEALRRLRISGLPGLLLKVDLLNPRIQEAQNLFTQNPNI